MAQNNIREWNNNQYSAEEGAAIIKELDDRTKHTEDGYDSIQALGVKVKNIEDNGGGSGSDGKSAFEIAQDNGFTGTESEWLTSLQGADGANGSDGQDGTDGADGAQGPQGPQGPAGADGADGADGSVTVEEVTQAEYDALTTAQKYDGTVRVIVPAIPSGYTVSIDQGSIDGNNDDALSFTFASAEVDSAYDYTVSTSGGAQTVSGFGVIATATDQITGIDITSLADGTITVTVNQTNAGGQGSDVTDTVTKDTAPPVTDLFPTGNAASDGAGEANSASGWTATGSTATVSAVANTDSEGGSYAIEVANTSSSWRYASIDVTGLNLTPHTATIRVRRVLGDANPFQQWQSVTGASYDINSTVGGASNGTWVEGTVSFTPTASTISVRAYSCQAGGTAPSEIEISSIIITED